MEDDVNSSDHGYDYLLSMPIWNLTMEKVESLLKEKLDKETQVKILIDQTILDLWRIDLDIFSEKWDEFETMINALESQEPIPKGKKKPKTAIGQMIKKSKKKSNDSDVTLSDEEVYAPKKKAPAVKKPTVLKKEKDIEPQSKIEKTTVPEKPKVATKAKKMVIDSESEEVVKPVKSTKNKVRDVTTEEESDFNSTDDESEKVKTITSKNLTNIEKMSVPAKSKVDTKSKAIVMIDSESEEVVKRVKSNKNMARDASSEEESDFNSTDDESEKIISKKATSSNSNMKPITKKAEVSRSKSNNDDGFASESFSDGEAKSNSKAIIKPPTMRPKVSQKISVETKAKPISKNKQPTLTFSKSKKEDEVTIRAEKRPSLGDIEEPGIKKRALGHKAILPGTKIVAKKAPITSFSSDPFDIPFEDEPPPFKFNAISKKPIIGKKVASKVSAKQIKKGSVDESDDETIQKITPIIEPIRREIKGTKMTTVLSSTEGEGMLLFSKNR
jgi:hypothetical protein